VSFVPRRREFSIRPVPQAPLVSIAERQTADRPIDRWPGNVVLAYIVGPSLGISRPYGYPSDRYWLSVIVSLAVRGRCLSYKKGPSRGYLH
jgi:hypothetical protein